MELTLWKIVIQKTESLGRNRDSGFRVGISAVCAATLGMAALLSGCNNDKIEVYHVPKERFDVAMQSGDGSLAPAAPEHPAQWTVPEGWGVQPLSEMRIGSFKVDGANGVSADVSITAFPGEAGGLNSNLNRWRGQLQLSPLSDTEIANSIQRIEVENVPAYLVDFETVQNNPKPSRILGAVLQRPDRTWFVKMTGPHDLLEAQREKFLDFVRSFHFSSPAASESAVPSSANKTNSTNDE